MDDKDCIKLLLNQCSNIHSRFNNSVEEILRRGDGKENVARLIESIRYVADDMERLIDK